MYMYIMLERNDLKYPIIKEKYMDLYMTQPEQLVNLKNKI